MRMGEIQFWEGVIVGVFGTLAVVVLATVAFWTWVRWETEELCAPKEAGDSDPGLRG